MVPPIKDIHAIKIDHINKKNSLLIIEFRDTKTKITLKSKHTSLSLYYQKFR